MLKYNLVCQLISVFKNNKKRLSLIDNFKQTINFKLQRIVYSMNDGLLKIHRSIKLIETCK